MTAEPPANSFAEALDSGRFVVTTEEPPPKGTDLSLFKRRCEKLRGVVDAINVTESSGAVMTMSPIGVMRPILEAGLHPILQMTCRDRNRIALQADLLAAAALGVTTVSCMYGDPIEGGEDPDAKGVFDLDTVSLLGAVNDLRDGHDMAGKALSGAPRFYCGAVANPGAPDLEREIAHMQEKVAAGARFFQTQSVYDVGVFERFMTRASSIGVPVIAGFIVLKSAAMARRLSDTLPDLDIPDVILREIEASPDEAERSIGISGRILSELRQVAQGLHVIAVGWESRIPRILEQAGVERP
jgi:5,10-methylenetetrahydrofolate reductase